MNSPQKIQSGQMDPKEIQGLVSPRPEPLKEYRCPVCRRLLFKGKIIEIETRCPKCKKLCRIKEP